MQASSVELIGTAVRSFNYEVEEGIEYKPVNRMNTVLITKVQITKRHNGKYIAEWWGCTGIS